MKNCLINHPFKATAHWLLFAHGAGAPMDSPFMQAISLKLCALGVGVVRFEFPYMIERRKMGKRRPPNKMEVLLNDFEQHIEACQQALNPQRLYIGGKSMGGRVASMLAQDYYQQGTIAGALCLGYPFHPRGKPSSLRIKHLLTLTCPTLIIQGSRDPLGSFAEVADYNLPSSIQCHWLEDGDHDFKPRLKSGFNWQQHLQGATEGAAKFILTEN
ncbi:MAG: alpha/beta hydrolase [Gammaproteobacteria bacterium]|nr:alpha/beta hydrolase [Gammaproteobacteria bacterium]